MHLPTLISRYLYGNPGLMLYRISIQELYTKASKQCQRAKCIANHHSCRTQIPKTLTHTHIYTRTHRLICVCVLNASNYRRCFSFFFCCVGRLTSLDIKLNSRVRRLRLIAGAWMCVCDVRTCFERCIFSV